MRLGHALQVAEQEVVEPLARGFRIDGDEPDGRMRRAGVRRSLWDCGIWNCGIWSGRGASLRTYNVFHQRGRVSA
jgi:hypothetical protein